MPSSILSVLCTAVAVAQAAVVNQPYIWTNVKIGGGGGFVPNIIFNTGQKGVAFARTDIGGAYKFVPNSDTWLPLLDFANDTTQDFWGTDALATDPVQPENLYIAVGLYTNSWDSRNGTILKSQDRGESFSFHQLPFKIGGNMPGRGMGERLVIDPNNNNILYFGARSGHGLWKSTDAGVTWKQAASFPSVGTYVPDPTDTSGLNSDIVGISFVTFDTNAKTSSGSSRIFVGVANMGSDNLFVSEDSGATWSAVAGQNNTFIPHHGVLSPVENAMYFSYANGVGPWDGTAGFVHKFFIGNSSWLDVTPAQGIADNSYGYSGISVDLQKPGTIMVAPFNEWYPDANILRSTDGGLSWTQIFSFGYFPPDYAGTKTPYYNYNVSNAPWITTFATGDTKQVGWGIQGLAIDPFDSNHWLYGTGLTIYGGHDLTNWDASPRKNVTIASLADGIEETAVQGLTAPLSGPKLISAVGDVGGFVHTDISQVPPTFSNPIWPGTASDVDHAGANPSHIVRLSGISGSTSVSVALSTDGGSSWAPYAGAPAVSANVYGGKIAISANGTSLLWTGATGVNNVQVSKSGAPFSAVSSLPSGAIIASDKKDDAHFYAASGAKFFVSTDGGATFTQTATLSGASSSTQIAANPFTAGDLFVSTDKGVQHSTDFGKTFKAIPGPTAAWSVSVGKGASKTGPASLYAAAVISGVSTLFRTDDLGANWNRITTAVQSLGATTGMVLAADPNVYGQVFVGTNGRGIFVGYT